MRSIIYSIMIITLSTASLHAGQTPPFPDHTISATPTVGQKRKREESPSKQVVESKLNTPEMIFASPQAKKFFSEYVTLLRGLNTGIKFQPPTSPVQELLQDQQQPVVDRQTSRCPIAFLQGATLPR